MYITAHVSFCLFSSQVSSSVFNLTNALVAEWEQISVAILCHPSSLVESHDRRVEAQFIVHIETGLLDSLICTFININIIVRPTMG